MKAELARGSVKAELVARGSVKAELAPATVPPPDSVADHPEVAGDLAHVRMEAPSRGSEPGAPSGGSEPGSPVEEGPWDDDVVEVVDSDMGSFQGSPVEDGPWDGADWAEANPEQEETTAVPETNPEQEETTAVPAIKKEQADEEAELEPGLVSVVP